MECENNLILAHLKNLELACGLYSDSDVEYPGR